MRRWWREVVHGFAEVFGVTRRYLWRRTEQCAIRCAVCRSLIRWSEGWYVSRDEFFCEQHAPGSAWWANRGPR